MAHANIRIIGPLNKWKQQYFCINKANYLQEISPLMHFLDVFICEYAACSFELAGALSSSSGNDRFMHTTGSKEMKRKTTKDQRTAP